MNSRRDALSGAKSSRDKGFKESGGQGKVALIYSGSLCLFSLKKKTTSTCLLIHGTIYRRRVVNWPPIASLKLNRALRHSESDDQ